MIMFLAVIEIVLDFSGLQMTRALCGDANFSSCKTNWKRIPAGIELSNDAADLLSSTNSYRQLQQCIFFGVTGGCSKYWRKPFDSVQCGEGDNTFSFTVFRHRNQTHSEIKADQLTRHNAVLMWLDSLTHAQ